jgi:signal peptidase II
MLSNSTGTFLRRSPTIVGLAVAPLWFAADQLSKSWVIEHLLGSPERIILVTAFFNLVLGWNRGVSFGMLSALALPPWTLALLAVVVAGGLLVWLFRTDSWLVSGGLGLVVGGAPSNALDRIRYGAVTDFLDFHLAGWHWPAFNLADAGIVCGVTALLLDAFRTTKAEKSASSSA